MHSFFLCLSINLSGVTSLGLMNGGICIQRHIVGEFSFNVYKPVFFLQISLFYVFNVLKTFCKRLVCVIVCVFVKF